MNPDVCVALAYMAYVYVRTMYEVWPTTTSWLTMTSYAKMRERFSQGHRYDVVGTWMQLCGVDENTMVNKEVTDEEIAAEVQNRVHEMSDDPDGTWLVRRFRANQLLSELTRGAVMMGYTRATFDPSTSI